LRVIVRPAQWRQRRRGVDGRGGRPGRPAILMRSCWTPTGNTRQTGSANSWRRRARRSPPWCWDGRSSGRRRPGRGAGPAVERRAGAVRDFRRGHRRSALRVSRLSARRAGAGVARNPLRPALRFRSRGGGAAFLGRHADAQPARVVPLPVAGRGRCGRTSITCGTMSAWSGSIPVSSPNCCSGAGPRCAAGVATFPLRHETDCCSCFSSPLRPDCAPSSRPSPVPS